jgi:arylsulfatase A-like enzyme
MHTGRPIPGFPTIGSWITYALGTENENLPSYVSMSNINAYRERIATGSAFLPSLYQGTPMNYSGGGDPFAFLSPPRSGNDESKRQRNYLQLTQALNRRHLESRRELEELDTRIQNFELAARMQVEAMKSIDVSGESEATMRLYGIDGDDKETNDFGMRCLLARRLVESGVRYVHLMHHDWDHHANLSSNLPKTCRQVDQPIAALLSDLKQRGLLESTLVVWTGEFGRLPTVEAVDGRDHNPHGFSFWMAGGGIKAGITHGATDEFGYNAIEDKVSVHDLHATMQHLCGIDPDANSFDFEGREETLTGVQPKRVVQPLIA